MNQLNQLIPDAESDDIAESGAIAARRQLFASLYEQLHGIARRELRRSGSWITLGATTLLHETYLNLGARSGLVFPHPAHFVAYASRAMRGLVLNYVRSRRALKRGALFEITSLQVDVPEQAVYSVEVQRLSDALECLAAVEPRLAQVVDLKYFGGFSFADIAAMLQLSERTIQRAWEKARLYLHCALSSPDEHPGSSETASSDSAGFGEEPTPAE